MLDGYIYIYMCVCVCVCVCMKYAAAAESFQLCPILHDPIDGCPPGSPVHRILQARTLEWVAISFSSAWKWKVKVKSLSCVQLSDPMDCNLPGSSVHGIFQVRVLEWVAIAFSDIWNILIYIWNTLIYIYEISWHLICVAKAIRGPIEMSSVSNWSQEWKKNLKL